MLKALKFRKTLQNPKGFTLMEMVVVLAVFSTTAIMAVDLFLTITRVQRQTRNVQAVQSDARFALEAMVREVRTGTIDYAYYKKVCIGGDDAGNVCNDDRECTSNDCGEIDLNYPTYVLATRDQENNQIFYRLTNEGYGDKIEVCSNTSEDLTRCNIYLEVQNNWQIVTPVDVKVTDLNFYLFPASDPFSVKNSCVTDDDCDSKDCVDYLCVIPDVQPSATIVLESEGGSGAEQEKVNMQTTSSSMVYRR